MNPQYAARHLIYDNFTETFASLILSHETSRVGHGEFGTDVFDAAFLGLFFGESYACHFRIGVYDARDGVVAHGVVVSAQIVDDDLCLAAGSVCQ